MSCRGANRLTPYGRLPAGRACSRRWTSSAVLHDGTGDLHHGQDKRTSPACCARRDTTDVRQQAKGDAGQNQKATPGKGTGS